jgi:hypothetical protein
MALKRLIFLPLLWLAALQAQAKVYYVNKGVMYHIGDNRFEKSEDAVFMDTYPVVGQEWIQAFTVDRPDKVTVRIEKVLGVDDCPYCKDLVYIDEALLGRLYAKDNHVGFRTLEPLDFRVVPGHTYYLKIESVGLEADDFVIGDVLVETGSADVTLMEPGPVLKNPGEPMPRVYPQAHARPSSPCDNLPLNHNWMLGWKQGVALPLSLSSEAGFVSGPALVDLKPGQAADFDINLKALSSKDAVSQALECLFQPEGQPASGWALLFSRADGSLQHANPVLEGGYTAESLPVSTWHNGQANRLRISRCMDGELKARLNGQEFGPGLRPSSDEVKISFRARGLQAQVASPETALPNNQGSLPSAP